MRQKVYYKMRHLFHYKMQQFYHKMRCFLQNALIHADIFANFIFQHLTYQLNKAGVTPVFEKGNKNYKTNYRPYPRFQKFMSVLFITRLTKL